MKTGLRSGESVEEAFGLMRLVEAPASSSSLDFAPNPFGAKPRRGQGVRVSMLSFFPLAYLQRNPLEG